MLDGGLGDDRLAGGAGNDMLTGGRGGDTLTGGLGADKFLFKSVSHLSASPGGSDTILDFSIAEGDRIDLTAIDASTKARGDQAFHLIGTKAFHGTAGELRYAKAGERTILSGDVNGDKKADFTIALSGTLKLTEGVFFL